MAVMVAADLAVLLLVGGFRRRGRGRRAGDVGDRGDVVPVDPMADAKGKARDQDAETGGGAEGGQEVGHGFLWCGLLAYWPGAGIATCCICGSSRLSSYTSRDARCRISHGTGNRIEAWLGGSAGSAPRAWPALDAAAPHPRRGPGEHRWTRDRGRARRTLPRGRPGHHPLDRVPDA